MNVWFALMAFRLAILVLALHIGLILHHPSAQEADRGEPLSLSLREACLKGIRHAREWQFQQQEAALARRQNHLEVRQAFPRLSFSIANRDQVTIRGEDSRHQSLNCTLSQTLYDGGRRDIQGSIRRLQLRNRDEQLEVQRIQILYEIEGLYFQLAGLKDQIDLLEAGAGIAADQLRIAERETELGLLRQTDLREMEIQQLETALNLNRKRETALQKEEELRDLLCLETGRPLNLTTPPASVPETMEEFPERDFLEREAIAYSPVLRKARRSRLEAEAQVQLAGRRLRPSITGKLSAGLKGEDYPLTDPSLDFSLSIALPSGSFPAELNLGAGSPGDRRRTRNLSLRVPVLSDLSGPLQAESARLALDQAVQKEENSRKTLLRKIPRLRREYRILLNRRRILDRQIDLQGRKNRILLTKLLQGQVTRLVYVEALLAQTDLRLRRRELLQEQHRHLHRVKQLCGIPLEETLP